MVTTEEQTAHGPIRVAFVGGFGHAVDVFDDFRALGERCSRLVACAPAYAGESLEGFSSHPWVRDSGAKQFDTLDAMLASDPPDLLIVSTRPDQISHCIEKGLKRGCHIISEKPFALDLATLDKLWSLSRQHSQRVEGMFSMRRDPVFRKARDLIADGVVGQVVLLNTRKSYKWGERAEWFKERGKYGGTWPWVGIHNLDMACLLTGGKVRRCFTVHVNRAHSDFRQCEDVAAGVFQLSNGELMTASIDLLRPDSADTHGDDFCRVVGTRGSMEISSRRKRISLERGQGTEEIKASAADYPTYSQAFRSVESCLDRYDPDDAFELCKAAIRARDFADRVRDGKMDYQFGNEN